MIYLAIGFPPAAKSSAYRMRETANQFAARAGRHRDHHRRRGLGARVRPRPHPLRGGRPPDPDGRSCRCARVDLETDIRSFTEARSLHPQALPRAAAQAEPQIFPEPVFGGWRPALEKALLQIHRERPADLLVTTCAPYVNLAATWKLWEDAPGAVRGGLPRRLVRRRDQQRRGAFTRDSPPGSWEIKLLTEAARSGTSTSRSPASTGSAIPNSRDKIGSCATATTRPASRRRPARPVRTAALTFGYLGSINFAVRLLDAVLTGWRMARREDPAAGPEPVRGAGHIGAGALREATTRTWSCSGPPRPTVSSSAAGGQGRGGSDRLRPLGRAGADAGRRPLRHLRQGLRVRGERLAGGLRTRGRPRRLHGARRPSPLDRRGRAGPGRGWPPPSSRRPGVARPPTEADREQRPRARPAVRPGGAARPRRRTRPTGWCRARRPPAPSSRGTGPAKDGQA